MPEAVGYERVRDEIGSRSSHILLGNGFSISCDPIFRYGSLFEAAVSAGLSEKAQSTFHHLGTNNFEGVMRLLEEAHWVAETYGLVTGDTSEMLDDVEIAKSTLIRAVADSHLAHTGLVAAEKKASALQFLEPYQNVFTTNYDLLVYWVVMSREGGPLWQDGFRSDVNEPDSASVVFRRRLGRQKGLFFLHGGLHLFLSSGELRKHCWSRSGRSLTDLISEGLDQGQYPLFVAEGSSNGKLAQIQRIGYLWYCLDKLARIEAPLVIFGHRLGDSDSHLRDTLALNRAVDYIAVSLYGDPESDGNQEIATNLERLCRQRVSNGGQAPQIRYFDSVSARVWGAPGLGTD